MHRVAVPDLLGWFCAATLFAASLQVPASAQQAPASAADPAAPRVTTLGYVRDASPNRRSLGGSGHAVCFDAPDNARFVEKIRIYAARYGAPQPPQENFHAYLLDENAKVLADLAYPYATVARGDMRWYDLITPPTEVTKRFYIALSFNPGETKGVFLGYDMHGQETHSLTGLPGDGFRKVPAAYDWMVRVSLTEKPSTNQGVRRLADAGAQGAPAEGPFAGCTEVRFDWTDSEGKQSYGGAGPALRFVLAQMAPQGTPVQGLKIKGFRIYASRYGGGFEPETTPVKVALIDAQGNVPWQQSFPYSLFGFQPKWVDLVAETPIPAEELAGAPISLAFDPEATATKGIFFHYNKSPRVPLSLSGSIEAGFRPVTDRQWMVRVYVVPAK